MEKFDVTSRLEMEPHPQGGYYKRTYVSDIEMPDGSRKTASSMYYLLGEEDISSFHTIDTDEIWNFMYGYPLDIYIITPERRLKVITLGTNLSIGETPQLVIPAGTLFGAIFHGGGKPGSKFLSYTSEYFTLVSCFAVPEFLPDCCRVYTKEEILKEYPDLPGLAAFFRNWEDRAHGD